MEVSSIVEKWGESRITSIRKLLEVKGINKTYGLSDSLEIKFKDGRKPSLEFYYVFYGKYVQEYYKKSKNGGFDIFGALKDTDELSEQLTKELGEKVAEQIKEIFKQIK